MKKVNNNLEPTAQKWVREVETSIDALEDTAVVLTEANRTGGITLRTITDTVAVLREQQDALHAQQATLVEQQNILSGQQATLTQIVNSIPITRVFRGTRTNFGVPGPETTQLTVTVPWEEGKTRCEVFAVASTEVVESETGNVLWRINIDSVLGDYATGWRDGLGTLGGMAKASATIFTETDFNVVLRSAPTTPFAVDVDNAVSMDIIVVFN